MLHFFRKIRRELLANSQFFKYLKYAIGEILLVVIGILIAFQVEKWNESSKERETELLLLTELVENLNSDITDMQANIRYHQRGIESAEIILTAFKRNLPYHDSINNHFVRLNPRFLVTKTAYNNLNQIGMRIIQNDYLRKKITFHYQHHYELLLGWNDGLYNLWFKDAANIYDSYFREFQYGTKAVPFDFEKLSHNQQYINHLNTRIGLLNSAIARNRSTIVRSEELINAIEKELELRN
jgi:hypothetical protein